jgi:diguanylate cyclase (GGDEF)-like protein
VLVDLDRFKELNEVHGHLAGDRVLRDVGLVLTGTVRDYDSVARQGGDEFAVLDQVPATTRPAPWPAESPGRSDA